MQLYDSHVHLASEAFEPDFADLLARMRQAGVAGCLVICDPGDLEPDHARAMKLVRENPDFHLAAACHPQNALHYTQATERIIREIAKEPFCRCIGETGLDYYDNQSTRDQQIYVLERHMEIALETGLPVQLHIRNAHGDMIEILSRRKGEKRLPRTIVHCFTRNPELARAYLRLGCYISVAGPATYSNANKLLSTIREIPADRLLIETDAPWVAPEPHRGTRNEPAFLIHTFRRIAQLREADPEALSRQLWENACAAFRRDQSFPRTQTKI